MGDATTGKNRVLGNVAMQYSSELRRTAVVAASEVTGRIPSDDSELPTTIDVIRREISAAGNPAAGIAPEWSVVEGLEELAGHVRMHGRWYDRVTNARIRVGEAERIVLFLDVPAGGHGNADEIFTTDRLRFTDEIKGYSEWEIREVRVSKRDGIVRCRVEYAKSAVE